MIKSLVVGVAAALALLPYASTAQAAHDKVPVTFTAFTTFEEPPLPDDFISDIAGCTSGTVDTEGQAHFTPWGGVFVGIKSFTCEDGESGFDVRLTARFGEAGSTGHWTVADGWGAFERLKGSGTLVGVPSEAGIDDIYTGVFR